MEVFNMVFVSRCLLYVKPDVSSPRKPPLYHLTLVVVLKSVFFFKEMKGGGGGAIAGKKYLNTCTFLS